VLARLVPGGALQRTHAAERESAPWYLFSGGVFGLAIVTCAAIAYPRLGAGTTATIAIASQLVTALVLDQFAAAGRHVPFSPCASPARSWSGSGRGWCRVGEQGVSVSLDARPGRAVAALARSDRRPSSRPLRPDAFQAGPCARPEYCCARCRSTSLAEGVDREHAHAGRAVACGQA
jgi:hypothetical protein